MYNIELWFKIIYEFRKLFFSVDFNLTSNLNVLISACMYNEVGVVRHSG